MGCTLYLHIILFSYPLRYRVLGASSGIGKAFALECVNRGAHVIISGHEFLTILLPAF